MSLWWLPNSTRYYSLDARVLDAGSLVNREIAGARSRLRGGTYPGGCEKTVGSPLGTDRGRGSDGIRWIRGCGCDRDPSYGVEVGGLGCAD